MKVHFYKYQATGNDFVLIDNRSGKYSFSTDQIKTICDRRFGVGADGLMLIENHPSANFNLQYFNSDGSQSLCGNGSRAAVNMAASLGIVNGKASFEAYDGLHDAEIQKGGIVRLKMNDIAEVRKRGDDYFINTGSPHIIRFVSDVRTYPVFEEGKKIRYNDAFKPDGGTNVNFVEIQHGNTIFVRTYERGVENETLSCGTGVTAAAIASSYHQLRSPVSVKTLGGDLKVEFKSSQSGGPAGQAGLPAGASPARWQAGMFEEIYLIGPAKLVFEGDLEL
ncbi:MAG: diaminopimelate epimerase [Cyclobacteriaceae bacterium]